MAQYGDDFEREDYSDVGNLLGDFNYANLNSEDPPEFMEETQITPNVPVSQDDNIPAPKIEKKSVAAKLSREKGVELLQSTCDRSGILMTKSMELQISSLCENEDITESEIGCYVLGYINCMTSHLMSALNENMSDMRVEVKKMQTVSGKLSKCSESIIEASASLSKEMAVSVDSLKEKLHDALENIETTVGDVLQRVDTAAIDKISSMNRQLAENLKMNVIPQVPKEDLICIKEPVAAVVVPETITPPPLVGHKMVTTVANTEDVAISRRDILSAIGFTSAFTKAISDDMLMVAIPPALLSEIKSVKLTTRIKDALKRIIAKNIQESTG